MDVISSGLSALILGDCMGFLIVLCSSCRDCIWDIARFELMFHCGPKSLWILLEVVFDFRVKYVIVARRCLNFSRKLLVGDDLSFFRTVFFFLIRCKIVPFIQGSCFLPFSFLHGTYFETAPRKVLLQDFQSSLILSCSTIDILYTLDSASNYSAIQKLKP